MLAVERERAKERQEELGKEKGGDPSGNVSQRGDEGRAREKAAEKVGEEIVGRDRLRGGERACGGAGQNAPIKKCIRRGRPS